MEKSAPFTAIARLTPSRALPLIRSLLAIAERGLSALLLVWTFGAVFYHSGPLPPLLAATLWLAATAVCWWKFPRRRRLVRYLAFAVVYLPYACLRPSNERDWQPEFARTGWTEVDGDRVTLHEFRNFDYDLDGRVTPRWETRTVHLSNFRGTDLFLTAFGGPFIAHPLASFDFGPDGRVVLSVETRRESHERFSAFAGLYKRFEIQYIFGSEEDLVRLRTNLRGEPVYLYRIGGTYDQGKRFFLDSLAAQNELHRKPRFYHLVTANCTTSLRHQAAADYRPRPDWRLLFNGKLDELIFERGGILTPPGMSFHELRQRSFINHAALNAHDASDFSTRIRAALPPLAKEPPR